MESSISPAMSTTCTIYKSSISSYIVYTPTRDTDNQHVTECRICVGVQTNQRKTGKYRKFRDVLSDKKVCSGGDEACSDGNVMGSSGNEACLGGNEVRGGFWGQQQREERPN